MALTTATITYALADLVGVAHYKGTSVTATTNIPGDTVIDTDGNLIRLGSGRGTIAADGTGSIDVWVPGVDSNPASWQTYIHVRYRDPATPKGYATRTFGPFTITASGDLADLVAEQEIPPSYLTTVTAELQAMIDQGLQGPAGPEGPAGPALPEEQMAEVTAGIAAGRPLAPFAWPLMHGLETETANLTIAISGDSVSAGATSWVNTLATELAADYPAWTIVQKNKTSGADTYDADITVQTGTGARTLTIYNWSQSGAGSGVGFDSDTVLHTAFPVAPDLFLIATGHNDVTWMVDAANRAFLRSHVRACVSRFEQHYPESPAAVVMMNPRTSADASYAAGVQMEHHKALMASDLGLGVLNLNQAWYDRASGYAALMGDTLHPNATGNAFLGETAARHFAGALKEGPTVLPRRTVAVESLAIPAMGGYAMSGTPAVAVQGGYGNSVGVAFDAAADEEWLLPGFVQIPASWKSFDIEVIWCPQGTNTGTVRWEVRYSAASTGTQPRMNVYDLGAVDFNVATNSQAITTYSEVTNTAPHVPSAFTHEGDELGRNYAPMQFRVRRLGAHANDTNASEALLYGLRLTRAT